MNSLIKLTSILLLSTGALVTHAGTDSITVKFRLNVPTACVITNADKAPTIYLMHNSTPVMLNIAVKCNIDYTIKASSGTKLVPNESQLINPLSTVKIPYSVTMTGGPTPVIVNGPASATVAPSTPTKTDIYTLSAKTKSVLAIEEYIAGNYEDTVTVEITY
jgi:spore coat protein U-like protein